MQRKVASLRQDLLVAASKPDVHRMQQVLTAAAVFDRSQEVLAAAEPDGSTALHIAARKGFTYVVELLLAARAAVDAADKCGQTPLHTAASSGHSQVLRLLLSAGASTEQRDTDGSTALHIAAERRHVDAARVLLQAGADADATDRFGNSALSLAVRFQCGRPRSPAVKSVVQLLLASGASVNTSNRSGGTALILAAYTGDFTTVELLLSAGACVHAADIEGNTALHAAAKFQHKQIAKLLLAAGAAVDVTNDRGMTPLSWAATAAALTDAVRPSLWKPDSYEIFDHIMGHHSRSPLAPAAFTAAAAAALDCVHPWFLSNLAVIQQLLSAAVQQDVAATRAALQQHWPAGRPEMALLTRVMLDMWLSAAADEEALTAGLPAVQQMVMQVSAAQAGSAEPTEG